MYQVISVFKGDFRHEGFYQDLRSAEEYRGWLSDRVFNCSDDDDFDVFVQEIDYDGK